MAKFSLRGGGDTREGSSGNPPKRSRIQDGDEEEEEEEERDDDRPGGGGGNWAGPSRSGPTVTTVTLTDPEVLDCSICFEALTIPVFQVCFNTLVSFFFLVI